MKIKLSELKQLIREAIDYDPLGDAGVPHVGVGPKYALAFVDASYGDRKIEWVVREEDMELARKVMKKMRRQGERSGVQPTRQKFDPRDVTTREDLERMLSESEMGMQAIPTPDEIEEWWEYMTPGAMKSVAAETRVGLDPKRWNAREWESVMDYYVQVEMGDPRGYQRGRNI